MLIRALTVRYAVADQKRSWGRYYREAARNHLSRNSVISAQINFVDPLRFNRQNSAIYMRAIGMAPRAIIQTQSSADSRMKQTQWPLNSKSVVPVHCTVTLDTRHVPSGSRLERTVYVPGAIFARSRAVENCVRPRAMTACAVADNRTSSRAFRNSS